MSKTDIIHTVCLENCIDTDLFFDTLGYSQDSIKEFRACKSDYDSVKSLTQQFIDNNF